MQRITAVTLLVVGLDVARRYYGALGWSEAPGGNTKIAFYKMQGFFLSLYLRDALENDVGKPVQEQYTGAVTLATNFGSEERVDAAFQKALDAGATPVNKPEKSFWGGILQWSQTRTGIFGSMPTIRSGLWTKMDI